MDLFTIDGEASAEHPGRFRFSWIAYLFDDPEKRVLFDSHPPKGAHFHIDSDPDGIPFLWTGLKDAEHLFLTKIIERFGEVPGLDAWETEGGQL